MTAELIPVKEKKLTARQERFCSEYIIDFNGYAAAKRAGYSEGSSINVHRILALPQVQAKIREVNAKVESKNIADATEVREFLTRVMRGEVSEQVPLFVGAGMQQLKDKEASPKDRTKAAELLGKSYSLFNENHSVEIQIPTVISGDHLLED